MSRQFLFHYKVVNSAIGNLLLVKVRSLSTLAQKEMLESCAYSATPRNRPTVLKILFQKIPNTVLS